MLAEAVRMGLRSRRASFWSASSSGKLTAWERRREELAVEEGAGGTLRELDPSACAVGAMVCTPFEFPTFQVGADDPRLSAPNSLSGEGDAAADRGWFIVSSPSSSVVT
jgi:hypothetical protein